MNTMKKRFNIATVLLLAAGLLLSCAEVVEPVGPVNGREETVVEKPSEPTYTMEIVAGKGEVGQTKALTLEGKTLTATWAEGETVTVYNLTTMRDLEGTLVAQSAGASTTLKGALTGSVSVGDKLTLKFLSPSYDSQDGTLVFIAKHCDYAEADVEVASVQNGRITTTGPASFQNKQAIVKFTLRESNGTTRVLATSLNVTAGTTTIAVTAEPASDELFVAIPAISGKDVRLVAANDQGSYAYKRTGATFEAGKYYTVTVKMSNVVTVYNEKELKAAISPKAHIILGDDITLTSYLKIGENRGTQVITLDLNGHTLQRTGLQSADANGHVIEVFTAGNLTITDSGTTGKITGGNANNGGGICNYGTLQLQGGTISGCKAGTGGAIKNNSGATLKMSGGTLSQCEGGDCGGIYNAEGGTLIITGGTINDCLSGAGGGGIVNYGTATLSGLDLNGNTATTRGGNLWSEGTLTMNDCIIQGGRAMNKNESQGGGIYLKEGCQATLSKVKIKTNESTDAGGIFVSNRATLILDGGSEISGNVSYDHGGGGIVNNGTVTLKGAVTIMDNSCETNGGGIWNNGTLNMEGIIIIQGNNDGTESENGTWVPGLRDDDVYLTSGHIITVTGKLNCEKSIGVRMQTPGVFTSGYGSHNPGTNSETDAFFPSGTINTIDLVGGEDKMFYAYYEAEWDESSKKVKHTVHTITETIENICSSTYASGGGLNGDKYWFIADGTGETANGLTCEAKEVHEVHLVLCDDSSIQINGGLYVNAGTTLYIHSQSYGGAMGQLISKNDSHSDSEYNPGIGGRGNEGKATGTIIIQGGDIKAYGGKYAAGIGGGSTGEDTGSYTLYSCGDITIYGGAISAQGGERGAGIGGGYRSSGGRITIYGGSISAQGGSESAGVGGGGNGDYCTVTVYNCESLAATGGWKGAGIGGGYHGYAGTITIENGGVTATGGVGGAGIGSGCDISQGNAIVIHAGNVQATGGKPGGAGIGTGAREPNSTREIKGGTITIEGGTVKATGGEGDYTNTPVIGGGAGIGTGQDATSAGTITISGGTVEAVISGTTGGYNGAGIGGGYNCSGATTNIQGGTVTAHGNQAIGHGSAQTVGSLTSGPLSLPSGHKVVDSSGTEAQGDAQREAFCRKSWVCIKP
jgi:hypothetical protein